MAVKEVSSGWIKISWCSPELIERHQQSLHSEMECLQSLDHPRASIVKLLGPRFHLHPHNPHPHPPTAATARPPAPRPAVRPRPAALRASAGWALTQPQGWQGRGGAGGAGRKKTAPPAGARGAAKKAGALIPP